MSIIKKLVSSVLVATMLCALAIPTMAATLPTSNDMIVETRDNIKFLEETTGTQYAKYTLGNEIPLYRVDGADIVPANDMQIYPIYGDSNVVGIYEVYSDGGSSFGSSYALKIDEAVKNGITEFFLLTNGNEVYLSDGDNTELLFVVTEGGMLSTTEYESTVDETIENQKQVQIDTLEEAEKVKSRKFRSSSNKEIEIVESVDFSQLESMISNLSVEKNTDFNKTGKFGMADITPIRTRAYAIGSNYKYIKTGTVNQGDTYLCWAVCTKLVGEYAGSGSFTIKGIADEMGIGYKDGANDDVVVDALWDCYDVWAEKKGYYNAANIKKWIDADKPIIGHWDELNGYMDHAVTIVGYYTDSDAIVTAESLDGYVGYKKINTTSGRHQYSYVTGRTYKYIASVVLEW